MQSDAPASPRWLIALVLTAALLRLLSLGSFPLLDTSEARYGDVARMMVATGDWITPWFDHGVPFWGKPPLAFWASAMSFSVFGVNEFAARLPHWLLCMAVALVLWRFARQALPAGGTRLATLAVALLMGCLLFYTSSGAVLTDPALALGTTLSMAGVWLATRPGSAGSLVWRDVLLVYGGLAIGLLSKGPIAVILTGLPVAAWLVLGGQWSSLWRPVLGLAVSLRGWLLLAVLVLPWYALAEIKTPGFLNYFIVGEHFKRFVVSGWAGDLYGSAHIEPRGSIWYFLFQAVLPWPVILGVYALLARWRRAPPGASPAPLGHRSLWVYLACWGLAPCVFFTVSGNVLWTYVLPGLPALALLVAVGLAKDVNTRRVDAVVGLGVVVCTTMMLAFIAWLHVGGFTEKKAVKALVAACPSQQVVFYPGRPFSGQFYSAGFATEATDLAQLAAKLPAARCAAFHVDALGHIPPTVMVTLVRIAKHGDYEIYSKKPL